MANPKCLASCQQKVNAFNIWGIKYAYHNGAARMKLSNAKCGNYLLTRMMAVPCLVCDSNFGFLYQGTLPGQVKKVRVSPEQCSHLMTECFEWSRERSEFNKGVYFYAVWMAKFASGQDFDINSYIPKEVNSWDRLEHCDSQWKKYKQVGRSNGCIAICESMYDYILSPMPSLLPKEYMEGLAIVYKWLGSEADEKKFEELTKRNIISDPALVQVAARKDWRWKAEFHPMLIADYEKSFAGKEVKQQSGLEVIKILLPVKNAGTAVVVAG